MGTNFAKNEFDHMEPSFARYVRKVVGRCHVADSNKDVITYVLSRMSRRTLQRDASPAMRRELWQWVIYCHGRNFTEYLMVTGGIYK